MKKVTTRIAVGLATTVGLAALATAFTSAGAGAATRDATASTSTTTTTLGPPAQGPRPHKLFLYVDTVAGGGTPKPASDCAMTNLFQRRQVVVFRMDGIQVATGGIDLTNKNVLNAFVVVPGEPHQPMFFANHGVNSYWTAGWTIPNSYPLGIINFSVWVTTKAVPKTATTPAIPEQTGIFSQNGLAPPSRLTVVTS
jgi:hypothetical protein